MVDMLKLTESFNVFDVEQEQLQPVQDSVVAQASLSWFVAAAHLEMFTNDDFRETNFYVKAEEDSIKKFLAAVFANMDVVISPSSKSYEQISVETDRKRSDAHEMVTEGMTVHIWLEKEIENDSEIEVRYFIVNRKRK